MEVINCTPHALHLINNDKEVVIEPSGICPRLEMTQEQFDTVEVNGVTIPIMTSSVERVIDMPEPKPNTIYVVSSMVAQAVGEFRIDVASPGELVRDDAGCVIGAKSLTMPS